MFKNKEGKIRSGWKIAALMASAYGIILILSMILGIVMAGYLMASGDLTINMNISALNFSDYGKQITKSITLWSMFIQDIILILVPIITWKFIMKRKLSDMGLKPIKSNYPELISGLVFGAASISVVFALMILTGNAAVSEWRPHFSIDQLIYLLLFIIVGFAEEILGRGYIMSVLRQTKSIPIILIVSSIIFALLHSANTGIGILPYINLALVGLLFGYMYIKSGSIWMCIGYHITWNYFQGNIYGFKVSGLNTTGILTTTYRTDNILNGGAFGPEGGLFVTLILLIGFLIVKLYYRNTSFDFFDLDPAVVPLPLPMQSEASKKE